MEDRLSGNLRRLIALEAFRIVAPQIMQRRKVFTSLRGMIAKVSDLGRLDSRRYQQVVERHDHGLVFR